MKKVAAIYLAAGKSKRFGKDNKLFANVMNVPLGTIALNKVKMSNVSDTIIVTNFQDGLFWKGIAKESHLVYVNRNHGQSASLKAGLHFAKMLDVDAVIVVLADQPFITKDLIQRLLLEYEKRDNLYYVAYRFGNVIAPPLLLSRQLFPEVFQLTGDVGAKSLIKKELENGLLVELKDNTALMDIDTQDELEKLLKGIDK